MSQAIDRIGDAFAQTRSEGRAAFVAYLVAGYPSPDAALGAAKAALDGGADILEIGVPFSDPMADGPVIAAASRAALAAGSGLQGALDLARSLRARGAVQPVLAMSYLNPLIAAGTGDALDALAAAGVDGLIVPDLPAGEDPAFEREVAERGLRIAFLVAPNTPRRRIERAIAASTAFLYVVPLLGVTGARNSLADGAVELVGGIRTIAAGRVPVVAGFGISSARQVARMGEVADGVVVGSALVQALGEDRGGVERVGSLVAELTGRTPPLRAMAASR
jgi:tryptophan synthase alpha chain